MDVFFVTTDSNPTRGATAYPLATLGKGLRALGHKVTVVVPGTAEVDALGLELARRLSKVQVELPSGAYTLDVRTGKTQQGHALVVLGQPEQFGKGRVDLEGDDGATASRLSLFAKAAARYATEQQAEAVHGLGVAGALAIAALPAEDSTAIRVLAVESATDVGAFGLDAEAELGLGAVARDGDAVVALLAGLAAAEAVVMPSSSVGHALAGRADRPALAAAMAALGSSVHVVLPGLDGAAYNPLTDPHLPSRFDPVDRSGKARCASVFCRSVGLPVRAGAALVAVDLESADEATVEATVEAVRAALRLDASVLVSTSRDVPALDDLLERWPDRLVVRGPLDEATAHGLLGAADVDVLARLDAASTTRVLAAMRYGAVPVVSRTHPVAGRLVDCEASLRTGNAFLADSLSSDDLVATVRRALASFQQGAAFDSLRVRAMRLDVSLERMARQMERLYRIARSESELRVAQH